MINSEFWGIRYTVLSISFILSITAIAIIVRRRLYERVLMVYVCIAASCEGLMALDAFFFTDKFVNT
jgi:hypothetical protein